MTCYFKLAAQFRTQEEPTYCGLSTLGSFSAIEYESIKVYSSYGSKCSGSGPRQGVEGSLAVVPRVNVGMLPVFRYRTP